MAQVRTSVQEDEVKAIREAPIDLQLKQFRSFHSFAGFYWRFIPGFLANKITVR